MRKLPTRRPEPLHPVTIFLLIIAVAFLVLVNAIPYLHTSSHCAVSETRGFPCNMGELYGVVINAAVAGFILIWVGYASEAVIKAETPPHQ